MAAARKDRSLTFRYIEGSDLDEALLREIWELRLTMLTLTRTREEDWDYFHAFTTRENAAILAFLDSDGAVKGFFTIHYIPVEHLGRRGLLMYSKYFYFHKDYRGHYKTMIAPWVLLPRAIARYGLRRMYFVTSAFPQSYVSLSRTSGNVVTLQDEAVTPWQEAALRTFAADIFGEDWSDELGLVMNQNVADSEGLPKSAEAASLARKYERLNPHWREGYSIPLIFAVDGGLIYHNVKRGTRQLFARR